MIRLFIIVVVGICLNGCVSTLQSPGGSPNDSYSLAVQKLADKGDASALKALAESEPKSVRGQNASAVLKHHYQQAKKIRKLNASNKKLKEENRQLKENIEKLNRINLEMEKR